MQPSRIFARYFYTVQISVVPIIPGACNPQGIGNLRTKAWSFLTPSASMITKLAALSNAYRIP